MYCSWLWSSMHTQYLWPCAKISFVQQISFHSESEILQSGSGWVERGDLFLCSRKENSLLTSYLFLNPPINLRSNKKCFWELLAFVFFMVIKLVKFELCYWYSRFYKYKTCCSNDEFCVVWHLFFLSSFL